MTQRQKQHLLGYLGWYSGPVDGIFGQQSRQAAMDFQKAQGLTPDGIVGEKTMEALLRAVQDQDIREESSDWWQDIRYWSREEFRCRCDRGNGPYCDGYPAQPQRKLVELADQVRAHFGRPGHASSGLRCPEHNRDCGGVANSRHLTGKALDFCIEGNDAAATLAYVRSLPGVRYAYAIDESYVHMDID